jgi:hypothetical protein
VGKGALSRAVPTRSVREVVPREHVAPSALLCSPYEFALAPFAAWIACHTRSGVAGMSKWRMP